MTPTDTKYHTYPTTPERPRDGEPCGHPGCLSHVSHPCEMCGRIGGYPVTPEAPITREEIERLKAIITALTTDDAVYQSASVGTAATRQRRGTRRGARWELRRERRRERQSAEGIYGRQLESLAR